MLFWLYFFKFCIYAWKKNLLNIPYFYLVGSVSQIYYFHLFQFVYSCLHWWFVRYVWEWVGMPNGQCQIHLYTYKSVLFQKNQFNISTQFKCQKQFYFKQFNLALVRSLNPKTVLFQTMQFRISTKFSSIWPINRTLSGATRVDLWAMAIKRYSASPKAPALLEPHHQIV